MLNQVIKFISPPKTDLELLQAQRLFHGRGHAYQDLHHVTIDWLPPVILITLFSPEPIEAITKLASELLLFIPSCQSIQLQHRYQQQGPIDIIYGKEITQLSIQENNLKFQIQLGKSRNTGLFLDMKNGRKWVENNSEGKHVLNLFSYTCGFSVAAIAGKAKSVLNIDTSSPALNIGRKNHQLNEQSLKNVRFEKLDILKSFGRLKRRGPFELLICDPPTFQKGSIDISKDYPKIIRRLNEFMSQDSALLLCLNAPELNQEFIFNNISKYAPNYKFIAEIENPKIYLEKERKGLKVLYFRSQVSEFIIS